MFFAELVAPWLIFGPRPLRWIAFGSTLGLQILIAATGNYGFFNLLSAILCLALLDDRDLGRREEKADGEPPRRVSRQVVDLVTGSVIVLVTTMEAVDRMGLAIVFPAPLEAVREGLAPLRSLNDYGLFAIMTTDRPEILVEGSRDGETWRPYRFRWKPGDLDRRPRFATPHLPRLDWQMWFAALARDCRATPWFLRFERKLLEGSPAVLALLAEDPFPGDPPRFLRAHLFLYRFTARGSPDWWTREEIGLFCPAVDLRDGELEVWPGLAEGGKIHHKGTKPTKTDTKTSSSILSSSCPTYTWPSASFSRAASSGVTHRPPPAPTRPGIHRGPGTSQLLRGLNVNNARRPSSSASSYPALTTAVPPHRSTMSWSPCSIAHSIMARRSLADSSQWASSRNSSAGDHQSATRDR
jgi:hypothetical protein